MEDEPYDRLYRITDGDYDDWELLVYSDILPPAPLPKRITCKKVLRSTPYKLFNKTTTYNVFNKEQKKWLEKESTTNSRPNPSDYIYIAYNLACLQDTDMPITHARINKWFKNKRTRPIK